MLKNYFEIDENQTVGSFLKEVKDKKNTQYIILKTIPKSFVDIRTISLRLHNKEEKLKNLKKTLSKSLSSDRGELVNFLIESGDRVIETKDGYYDFIDALNDILAGEHDFLKSKISSVTRKEIFALNEKDMISTARNIFIRQRVNILPIIDKDLKISGELRPMDLMAYVLHQAESDRADFYNQNYENSPTMNMSVSNLANKKPITIDKDMSVKDAIKIFVSKKIPSLIVTESGDKLYTVISYKDIFKQVKKDLEVLGYSIDYVGSDDLFEDEFDLIQDYVEKSIKKISNMSPYNKLKVTFKQHGKSEGSHMKKIEVNMILSHGKKILHFDKDVSGGTSDEEHNDKRKEKWNVPQVVMEGLNVLIKKVKEEKEKDKKK